MDFTAIKNTVSGKVSSLASGAGTIAQSVAQDCRAVHAAVKGDRVTSTIRLGKLFMQHAAVDAAIIGVTASHLTCKGTRFVSGKIHDAAQAGEDRTATTKDNLEKLHDEIVDDATALIFPNEHKQYQETLVETVIKSIANSEDASN